MADNGLPNFLKQKDQTLLFNESGELHIYLPESYFTDNKKSPVVQQNGQYVNWLGIADWALVSTTGTVGTIRPFKYPTIVTSKPYSIEKIKEFSINGCKPRDYRIMHFKYGDEVISDINIPMQIDNVMTMFNAAAINSGKIPNTIPYDKLHEYFPLAMRLNGSDYGLNMQLFGIMVSELCRDPEDNSKPFRQGEIKSMTDYTRVSVRAVPKFISPYIAITSENFDESLMSAVLLSDEDKITKSPLEKIMMA